MCCQQPARLASRTVKMALIFATMCRACSQPAVGFETTVTIGIAEEVFLTTGELKLSSLGATSQTAPPATSAHRFSGADVLQPAIAGLMVTQRNWLDVYPYTNWGGNADLPVFTEGQRYMPSQLLLAQARCHCCI
jgi:hypothetical protein